MSELNGIDMGGRKVDGIFCVRIFPAHALVDIHALQFAMESGTIDKFQEILRRRQGTKRKQRHSKEEKCRAIFHKWAGSGNSTPATRANLPWRRWCRIVHPNCLPAPGWREGT